MTCACASVVEARGSYSRGFLDAGSRLRLITPETTPPSIPTNPAPVCRSTTPTWARCCRMNDALAGQYGTRPRQQLADGLPDVL